MKISKYYVVFEMNKIMGNEDHLSLKPVDFKGFVSNWFDSEAEAIQALVDDKKTYENYYILKEIRIYP